MYVNAQTRLIWDILFIEQLSLWEPFLLVMNDIK